MFGIASFSAAPFSSLAGQILLASASITGFGNVTANGYVITQKSASIIATGSVNASGLRLRDSQAQIIASSAVECDYEVFFSANGTINCEATLKVGSLGNIWTNTTVTPNTWTDVSVIANAWTEVIVTTNAWTDYNNYVYDGYWFDNYVIANRSTWIDKPMNTNAWI